MIAALIFSESLLTWFVFADGSQEPGKSGEPVR